MKSVTLIPDTGLVHPVGKNSYGMKLVKMMKPLEKFATSGFGSKAFINFPLCYAHWQQDTTA